jgi:hypothetical protein
MSPQPPLQGGHTIMQCSRRTEIGTLVKSRMTNMGETNLFK